MVKNILTEKDYQKFILSYLESENDYVVRKATSYKRSLAIDETLFFKFLRETQPKKLDELKKLYKDDYKKVILGAFNVEKTKYRGSLLALFKDGLTVQRTTLKLMYTKPETTFNSDLTALYEKNIFSVMEEVWASDSERIDVVIFLNGIAIMTFELKSNMSGQNYHDAIKQYRTKRNPKTPLFSNANTKGGVLVNFAMDLQEVYMATTLEGAVTTFLPFNKGSGEGINTGAGNPLYEDRYSVSYMWEEILKKDSILELIKKFMFIEEKTKTDSVTGKKHQSTNLIFPRFHQLDLIHKILADVKEHKTALNYLIQHSAGSGKTKSIAWLAYRLMSLHDKTDAPIFDKVVIMTDRLVVDRQLQQAILSLKTKSGIVQVMDDEKTSGDLAKALDGQVKIIVTTIQKFQYILDQIKNLKKRKFAVIIDEAHSSTSGKNMGKVTEVLSKGEGDAEEDEETIEDKITEEIRARGKQENVSMFAFTATPKATTLELFGRQNADGKKEAFHLYSMKQAIEEGFIIDVLQNFTEYATMYQLNKIIEDDPEYKSKAAKKKIARFISLHETNISQRIEIVVKHFRDVVRAQSGLGKLAKAMIVTPSRAVAVSYKLALEKYLVENGYHDLKALVAFTGKVTLDDDDQEYTEYAMNGGLSEDKLAKTFDEGDYHLLIVANKYQTGFDQDKLCAMYVFKKLNDVKAVQTYSRLNRICYSYDKKTYILDFENSYGEVQKSFAPYYTTTLLKNSITPKAVYDLELKVDEWNVLDPSEIEEAAEIFYKEGNVTSAHQARLAEMMGACQKRFAGLNKEQHGLFVKAMKGFIKCYEFLIQASCFEDVQLHKKYLFLDCLKNYVSTSDGGRGFSLKDKIIASKFAQNVQGEHKKSEIKPKPDVSLPITAPFELTPDKEKKLSMIIEDINSRLGTDFDVDVVSKSMLQVRDLMKKSDELRTSAKANTLENFKFSYDKHLDDILIQGLDENYKFFQLLLNNDEVKKDVLGIFAEEIYKSLKKCGTDE